MKHSLNYNSAENCMYALTVLNVVHLQIHAIIQSAHRVSGMIRLVQAVVAQITTWKAF